MQVFGETGEGSLIGGSEGNLGAGVKVRGVCLLNERGVGLE